jgi:hypothetical protein
MLWVWNSLRKSLELFEDCLDQRIGTVIAEEQTEQQG